MQKDQEKNQAIATEVNKKNTAKAAVKKEITLKMSSIIK